MDALSCWTVLNACLITGGIAYISKIKQSNNDAMLKLSKINKK